MRVALVGGTFDPPHNSHLELARISLSTNEIDQVWFLPCWKHAFGKDPSSFEHRTNMLNAMIEGSSIEKVTVCVDEKEVQSTYSIEIISYIVNKYNDIDFTLVLGTDNYWKLTDWKNFNEIRKLVGVMWIARSGEQDLPQSENVIGSITSEVSSTLVRKLFKENGDVTNFIQDGVIEYIKKNNIYKGE